MIPFSGFTTIVHLLIILIGKTKALMGHKPNGTSLGSRVFNAGLAFGIVAVIGLGTTFMSYLVIRTAMADTNSNLHVIERVHISSHIYAFLDNGKAQMANSKTLTLIKPSSSYIAAYSFTLPSLALFPVSPTK
jgi:hypothetical protein